MPVKRAVRECVRVCEWCVCDELCSRHRESDTAKASEGQREREREGCYLWRCGLVWPVRLVQRERERRVLSAFGHCYFGFCKANAPVQQSHCESSEVSSAIVCLAWAECADARLCLAVFLCVWCNRFHPSCFRTAERRLAQRGERHTHWVNWIFPLSLSHFTLIRHWDTLFSTSVTQTHIRVSSSWLKQSAH